MYIQPLPELAKPIVKGGGDFTRQKNTDVRLMPPLQQLCHTYILKNVHHIKKTYFAVRVQLGVDSNTKFQSPVRILSILILLSEGELPATVCLLETN